MNYLLYAIVHGDRSEPHQPVRFLGYPRASIMVRAAGLGGVASPLAIADSEPDVTRLLVYSKVIEAYNDERSVVPMRYGCRFESVAQIRSFLELKRGLFSELLRELDGNVEMSLRIALAKGHPGGNESKPVAGERSGIRYLEGRRLYYDALDVEKTQREEIHERARAMAAGTFSRSLAESSISGGEARLLIHFLVRRERLADFRGALTPFASSADAAATLTGPWPPYNFVSARAQQRMR